MWLPHDRRDALGHGAWLEHHPAFVDEHEALMARLVATLPLHSETIVIFGKNVATPRLTSWHGDAACVYSYSGRTFTPAPWTAELTTLRDALEAATGTRFNSVLANLYRTGLDSMGAHSDDEPELGPTREDLRIASISLGARRRFCLRPKQKSSTVRRDLDLGEGDLLLMGGTTQAHFLHHVPRTQRPVGPRLNLTFRVVLPR